MSKDFVPRGAFQTEATKFLVENRRCSLHISMGLGKTIMVLNAIDALILAGECRPFLILAPLRVARTTWVEEASKWNHLSYLKVSAITGTLAERIAALQGIADVYTTNYENLPWLKGYLGDAWPFRGIVADESTKLKSHRACFVQQANGGVHLRVTGGARAEAIARVAYTKNKYFWNLTGLASPNGLCDLWGPQWFIDKGESLGRSYSAFEQRWCKKGYKGFTVELLPHSAEEIRKAISSTTFALDAKDYLDLGEEIENNIYVDLPPAARAIYRDMEKDLYIKLKSGDVEVFTQAVKQGKCQQLANGAVYYDDKGSFECTHDAKIEALQSVIEEAAGAAVIVVYQFKSDLERLLKAFPKGKALGKKVATEKAFKAGKIKLLFMQPDNAGYGIDQFQYVCNIICFFGLGWNLESRKQVIGRVGAVRQFQAGLNRPCYIHNLIARDTVDESILERIATKCSVEDALKAGLARRNLK